MATDPNVFNLFVGSCELYIDDEWVGWTRGGIRMRVNKSLWGRPSFYGLGVDEIVKQSEDYYISTILVETTMLNVRRAWGINETPSGFRTDFGGSITIPVHTLRFIARDGFFEGYFYKAVAVDFGEISFSKTSDASIPVTFRAILDVSKEVGAQIGYVVRRLLNQSNLVARVTVPKIKTYQLYGRVVIFRRSSKSLINKLSVVFASGASSLVSALIVSRSSYKDLPSRVTAVYAEATAVLQARVSVTYAESYKDLPAKIAILIESTKELQLALEIRKLSTLELPSLIEVHCDCVSNLYSKLSVVRAEEYKELTARLTVFVRDLATVTCRVLVAYTPGTLDLTSRLIVRCVESTYVGGIIEVERSANENLICRVNKIAA